MKTQKKPNIFVISQILDKTTIILTGESIGTLSIGDELSILAKGQKIQKSDISVYVVKGELEVIAVTGAYTIARPPELTKKEPIGMASLMTSVRDSGYKTVYYRPELNVLEDEERGNPKRQPIKTGDIVILEKDFRIFVDSFMDKGKSDKEDEQSGK